MKTEKMFAAKKQNLFDVNKKTSVVNPNENPFISRSLGESAKTLSGNGATKYSTSGYSVGSKFLDQFATISQYKAPRNFSEISKDMEFLWSLDPEMTVKFSVYIRMITRVSQLPTGEKMQTTQRGAGLKHEGISRMLWIAVNHPEVFSKNIQTFIAAGSWKDIITMLSYDLQYHGWDGKCLDWDFLGKVILAGLTNDNTINLVKKYLPQIKSNSKCKTLESQADNIIAKWLCSILFGNKTDNGSTYKKYRILKNTGTAHQWQQLISQGKHKLVNFDSIHGRALALLVGGKYLKNQGLEEKYEKWIESKPVAKFTGYPYELTTNLNRNMTNYVKNTINAQFNNLVEVAKNGLAKSNIRPISVVDTSGSMSCPMYIGSGKIGKLKSIEVAFSSAIFFNEMMDKNSPFYDVYLEFSNSTKMIHYFGNNFVDKYLNTNRDGWGGTNFQSVFDFLVNFKKNNPDVSEDLIPNFIVCFSDGEFDGVSSSVGTNVEAGRKKLSEVFSKEYCENFGMCFVDLPNTFYSRNRNPKFETFGNSKNTFYFSGYDLSPLGFLFGIEGNIDKETGEVILPKTGEDLFYASMDQELLNLVIL